MAKLLTFDGQVINPTAYMLIYRYIYMSMCIYIYIYCFLQHICCKVKNWSKIWGFIS